MSGRYKVLDLYDIMSINEFEVDKISDYEVNNGYEINDWHDVKKVCDWWDNETDGENFLVVLDRRGRVIDAYNKRLLFTIESLLDIQAMSK